MKQFSYTITDPVGLHARPAGLLVKEAGKFSSDISITLGEKTANLKKLFAVMGLGVKQNNEVIVAAEGDDEEQAAQTIERFMQDNL